MRKVLTVIYLMVAQILHAQLPFEILFGDPAQQCFPVSMIQLPSGTLIVASNNVDSTGNQIIRLNFFNPDGNPQFAGELNIPGVSTINKMKRMPDGNLLLAGSSTDSTGQMDGLLIKADTSGNIIWHAVYGSAGENESLQGIDFSGDTIFSSGYSDNPSGQGNAFYLVSADAQGNLMWQHSFGTAFNSYSDAVIAFGNGRCILSGDRMLSSGNYTNAIISTDSTGNIYWDVEVPNPNNNGCKNDLLTTSGDILIMGESATPGNPSFEPFITRIDTSGNIRWSYIYNGSAVTTDALMDAVEKNDGSFVLAGYGGNPANGTGDFLLMEIDSVGIEKGRTYFGDSAGTDIAYAIVKGINGGFYLCGISERNLVSRGCLIYTQWNATVSIQENKSVTGTVYPNPAGDYVNVPWKEQVTVNIYNLSGIRVFATQVKKGKINIETLQAGMYMAIAVSGNEFLKAKFIKEDQ